MTSENACQERLPASSSTNEIQRDQRVLGPEAVIQRLLGRPRGFGEGVHPGRSDATVVEQLIGSSGDPLCCRSERRRLAWYVVHLSRPYRDVGLHREYTHRYV